MTELLRVSNVSAGYRGGLVLEDVSLSMGHDEAVAVLGRNGVGKTTLVRAITRTIPISAGDVLLGGRSMRRTRPDAVSRAGVALVPQGRGIWPNLTVDEHLTIARRRGGAWNVARCLELFGQLGALRRRRADTLSGGEQQMLVIARALVTNPSLLILDEPFEGLAPAIGHAIQEALEECIAAGMAILLIEHDLRAVTRLAHRVAIIERGRIAFEADVGTFRRSRATVEAMLGVG